MGQRAVSARWPGGVACFVSPCLPAVAVSCARWPCSPARDGGPVWIARRRADGVPAWITTGPARCRSLQARPPIWPGLVGYIGDFQPVRASGLPCTALSRPGWPVVPARWRSWPVGLVRWPCWAVGGWFGLPAGLRCLFGAKGVPVLCFVSACLTVGP